MANLKAAPHAQLIDPVTALKPEMYAPPSQEARFLLRHLPGLVSPPGGKPGRLAGLVLMVLVAPMTQLTFVSFNLQSFLFLVFHRKWPARMGHGVFMTTENLFILAFLRQFVLAQTPFGALDGGLAYALLLLVWYGVVAWQERLLLWWAVMVPVVGALYLLSGPVLAQMATLGLPVWSGIFASAFLIAASHAPESALPPRASDPQRWLSIPAFVMAPGLGLLQRLGRALRIPLLLALGALDECWAAPRLMSYNYLMILMRFGYAPDLARKLNGWCDDAWKSGNPALDYVGTGGGTFLTPSGSVA